MKTHSYIFSLIATFVILATRLAHAQGVIIAQHSGFNNPTGEGFVQSGFGSSHATGITNDLGANAWITPVSNSAIFYTGSISNISGLNWILSVNDRIATANTSLGTFYVNITTGSSSFYFSFGSDGNGNQLVSIGGTNFTLNGGSVYNNYQLIYSSGTDTASFWINGIEDISGIAAQTEFGSSLAFLEWGGGYQSPANFQANWNLVSLSIVPEPSAMSLISLGTGVLIYVRTRNKRHSAQSKSD